MKTVRQGVFCRLLTLLAFSLFADLFRQRRVLKGKAHHGLDNQQKRQQMSIIGQLGSYAFTKRFILEHQSEDTGRTPAESTPRTGPNGERRDRSEIIRIARTMVKAGASDEKIKRLIPISDAELSLLSMSKS